ITGPSRCVPACGRQRCGSEHAVTDTPQISNVFIRRPIFSGVISIVIVLLGLFALRTLPVNSYPALTPPEIQVQAVYPGATAQDVAAAVAAPIEQQLSGLDGLLYFKSSNSSAGVMNLSVFFDVSRNPDLAAVDVQNQIALAEPPLPQEVVRNGITVQKRQTSILVVGARAAGHPAHDPRGHGGPAHGPRPIRADHRAGTARRLAGARQRHRRGPAGGAELRRRGTARWQAHGPVPRLPPTGSERAPGQAGG